ncbi:MAG: hypothetical protein U0401_03480 [Anaerolineae bacterium]
MGRQKFFPRFFLSIFLLLVITSCSNTGSVNQPDFAPIRPDPPTAPAIAPGRGTPTPVISNQIELTSYTHPSQRFSINYPANWSYVERPDGVVFLDPGDQAGYSVFFAEVGQKYTEEQLKQYLATFVAKNFAQKESQFSPMSQEKLADNLIVAQFASTDPKLGQAISEVRVLQKETFVFVVYINTTKEQWQLSQEQFHRLAESLAVLDTKPAAATTPTEEPPQWLLIGPTENAFGFYYPSNWQIVRQDESSVSVMMPQTDMVFEAKVSKWTGAEEGAEAAKKAAEQYVETLKKNYQNVQSRSPEKFPLDQISDGATIDYLYTGAEGKSVAGSVITGVSQGKLYQVVFSSSAELNQIALNWFNPMYKSFKILPVDEMMAEPK